MNNHKAKGLSLYVIGIIFLVYNVFVYVLIKPQTGAFWVSYAFMLIAFAMQLASLTQAVKNLDVETVFFGIPLMQCSLFYFFAELFASTVFMLFQNHLGIKIPALIQLLLLAIFAVFAILSIAARDATKAVKDDYKEKAASIKMLSVDVSTLADSAADAELKSKLRRLSESIKFSDPMTTDLVADLDMRIRQEVSELRIACEDNSKDDALRLCGQIERMVVERNKKLLASK